MRARRLLVFATALVGLMSAMLVTQCSSTTEPPVARVQKPDTQPTQPTPTPAKPQLLGDLNVRSIDYQGTKYLYQVFLPKTYTPTKRFPVIMSFHGSGARGTNNTAQLGEGLGPLVREEAATFPAIVILPQVPTATRESQFVPVGLAILDQEMKELNGDPTRVYLTGWSYGGYVAYDMAYAAPARFAALVPLGALFDFLVVPNYASVPRATAWASFAQQVKSVPIWIFQGALDPYTPVADARLVVDALKLAGADYRYTEYPTLQHDVQNATYHTPALFTWLYAQHR